MSIRFIGLQSYVPAEPGNYTRGKTKIIKVATQPDQHEQKVNKIIQYRQQLDKQVQQMRRRKDQRKKRQQEQDAKRQRDFYQSLQKSRLHAHHHHNNINSPQKSDKNNKKNFHYKDKNGFTFPNQHNPQDQQNQNDDTYDFQTRMAHIGKNRYKLNVPVFQRKSQLINDQQNYNEVNLQQRRRSFIQEMDRSLMDAFLAIQRSKTTNSGDEQFDRVRRKLRTEASPVRMQSQDVMYNLPFKSYLYNNAYKYKPHQRRESSWM